MAKRRNLNAEQWAELIAMVDWAFEEAKTMTGSWPPFDIEEGTEMFEDFRELALAKLETLRSKSKAAGVQDQSFEEIMADSGNLQTRVQDRYITVSEEKSLLNTLY